MLCKEVCSTQLRGHLYVGSMTCTLDGDLRLAQDKWISVQVQKGLFNHMYDRILVKVACLGYLLKFHDLYVELEKAQIRHLIGYERPHLLKITPPAFWTWPWAPRTCAQGCRSCCCTTLKHQDLSSDSAHDPSEAHSHNLGTSPNRQCMGCRTGHTAQHPKTHSMLACRRHRMVAVIAR